MFTILSTNIQKKSTPAPSLRFDTCVYKEFTPSYTLDNLSNTVYSLKVIDSDKKCVFQ